MRRQKPVRFSEQTYARIAEKKARRAELFYISGITLGCARWVYWVATGEHAPEQTTYLAMAEEAMRILGFAKFKMVAEGFDSKAWIDGRLVF